MNQAYSVQTILDANVCKVVFSGQQANIAMKSGCGKNVFLYSTLLVIYLLNQGGNIQWLKQCLTTIYSSRLVHQRTFI